MNNNDNRSFILLFLGLVAMLVVFGIIVCI